MIREAKEHSKRNKWAWIVKEPDGEIYYTDCMEYTVGEGATGEVIAEFHKGERLF